MSASRASGPWSVYRNGSYGPFIRANGLDSNGYGTAAHDRGIETHAVASLHGPLAEEHAALIVRAVNERDELRAALLELVEHAEERYPHFESERGQADIARARAALRALEGAVRP